MDDYLLGRPMAAILIAVLVAIVLLLNHRTSEKSSRAVDNGGAEFWASQEWIQPMKRVFDSQRSNIASIFGLRDIVALGYAQYSKKGIPFAITTPFSGPMIIVPQDQIRNVYNRPPREIDAHNAQMETLQSSYTVQDKEVYDNNFHFKVVRNQLTRNLAQLSKELTDELSLSIDDYGGKAQSWRSVKLWDFTLKVVARGSSRVFVGPTLCRNEKYLEGARSYTVVLFGGAIFIRLFPTFLQPIVGALVGLNCKRHSYKVEKAVTPIIEERLRNIETKAADSGFDWKSPEDGIKWVLDECARTKDPKQLDAHRIAKRMLALNMVAMHTTSGTITQVLLDIFSSPNCHDIVATLREEIESVLKESKGEWTKEAVARLHYADSTIRESMRRSSPGIAALPRRVNMAHGLEMNGKILPKGTKLVAPMHEINHDPRWYTNPTEFDPFRFVSPRSSKKTHAADFDLNSDDEDGNARGARELSATTVSDHYLSFGYGRDACPGRFFAVYEMKIMLSMILQRYDVEPLPERPPHLTLVDIQTPRQDSTIRIRRRNVVVGGY